MYFPVTVPYKTSPVMNKNTELVYQKLDNFSHMIDKSYELNRWGEDLYGCRRPDLVKHACLVLNLPITNDIVKFAMNFREDVAIMSSGVLEAICFCYPSSWIPSHRIGMSLAEIHGPVADGDMLRRMSQKIAETMATQGSFRRYVWTISTTAALSNHPKVSKPDVTKFTTIDDLYFRMETQTTMPLGDGVSSLFFVNVETCPLSQFWEDVDKRKTIVDSINSMSDAILEYKNLFKVKDLLNSVSPSLVMAPHLG